MMGVAVGQLLAQVYEGVEDWQRGDHQQALAHLLSVAENIALMGGFCRGAEGVGDIGTKIRRAHPEFFGQFTAVLDAKGQPRLWKPDLGGYEHRLPAGFTVAEDAVELYQIRDKSVGRVDHQVLSGVFDAGHEALATRPPCTRSKHMPRCSTDTFEGGWRFAG